MNEIHSNNDGNIAPSGGTENGLRGYTALGLFLENDGWHPQPVGENGVYRVYFSGAQGEYACFAQVRTDLEQLLFYIVMPLRVPEMARPQVAEFITRANYGLRIGNFEMDYEDGEVRYKSSLDFEGEELTPNWIRSTVYPAVQTMDRYMPGILAVVFGGKTPVEAISEVEEAA
jgi:hypothetical protein